MAANKGKVYESAEDPGVVSVTSIYKYYKQRGSKTVVMGASFRNKGEILELAGCDKLTISPALLDELAASNEPISRKLVDEHKNSGQAEQPKPITEAEFRYQLNEDQMATEKLSDGIRKFAADTIKLESIVRSHL